MQYICRIYKLFEITKSFWFIEILSSIVHSLNKKRQKPHRPITIHKQSDSKCSEWDTWNHPVYDIQIKNVLISLQPITKLIALITKVGQKFVYIFREFGLN